MTQLPLEESHLNVTLQQKNILIAIDLEEHSEQIIAYSLLVTQRLFCKYSVLYCLGNGVSLELAHEKMTILLEKIDNKYSNFANRSLNTIILAQKPATAIQELHQIHDYNCVMVGSSNQDDSWEMGATSKGILLTVSATILVIPPKTEFIFPNNISVLIEKKEKPNLEQLVAFNKFVAYDNVFINFVFFLKNTKIMEEEKILIEGYQRFFESNFTFAFIVEAVQSYLNFFKYIEETYCTAAVILWDESSGFYKSLADNDFALVPCSPKIPVLYTKKRELLETL